MEPNVVYGPPYPQPMQNQYSVPVRGAVPQPHMERKRSFEELDEIVPISTKRQSSDAETVFRLLVADARVDAVMNGSSEVQLPTGCFLRLCERVPSCDERVIVISAKDERKDDSNVAMQGLLDSVRRTLAAEQSTREITRATSNPIFMIRLLINRTQAGAVIGKGGILNKDIRERTGAYSKILTTEDIPTCALHNDRVVQVTGSVEQVLAGMEIIARQLRDNVPKERPGGPPPCLSVLSGFTMYYAHEAPPFIPATDYGQPLLVHGALQSTSFQIPGGAPPMAGHMYGMPPTAAAAAAAVGYPYSPSPGNPRMYPQPPMMYPSHQGRPPPFSGSGGHAFYY